MIQRKSSQPQLVAVKVVALVAVLSAALTAIVAVTDLHFAVVRPELRLALETAQALVALVTALLLYGRARRSGLTGDLALVAGLFLVGLTNLFYAAVLALAPEISSEPFTRFMVWFPLVLRTIGAALVAWAAVGPNRRHGLARPGWVAVTGIAGIGAVASVVVAATVGWLPEPLVQLNGATRPHVEGHPALLGAQVLVMGLWATAAVGFARRHRHRPNPMNLALAVGAALAAFSRANFILHPSLYTDVVHVGDMFRLLSHAVLAAGVVATIVGYWRTETAAAAATERERLASEIHDGLTQELAFLRSQLTSLAADRTEPKVLPHLADAADRAMVEARRLVQVLDAAVVADSPDLVLADAARQVTERAGVPLQVQTGPGLDIDDVSTGEVARIVREATTNAVRHAAPATVTVDVRRRDGVTVVSVSDDGNGFDPDAVHGGYGLRSMRRRAATLGADLHIRSAPGHGTTVELHLQPGR